MTGDAGRGDPQKPTTDGSQDELGRTIDQNKSLHPSQAVIDQLEGRAADARSAARGRSASGQTGASDWQRALHFLTSHFKRAFSLHLREYQETTVESERLQKLLPEVTSAEFRTLLIWRKSLMFVAGCMIVPSLVLQIIKTYANLAKMVAEVERVKLFGRQDVTDAYEVLLGAYSTLHLLEIITGIGFAVGIWVAFRNWTAWHKSRRILFWSWVIAFTTPFLVYVVPLRMLLEDSLPAQLTLTLGSLWGMQASMALGPKVLTLMPGILRSSIVTKVLFPGASAPGWLMTLAAPLFALLAFVVLVVPLQVVGSGALFVSTLFILSAPIWLWRAGYKLAYPMDQARAMSEVMKARVVYLVLGGIGILFLVIAFYDMIKTLKLGFADAVHPLFNFFTTLFILTVIITDLLITSLGEAKQITIEAHTTEPQQKFEIALWDFVDEQKRDRVRSGGPAAPSSTLKSGTISAEKTRNPFKSDGN